MRLNRAAQRALCISFVVLGLFLAFRAVVWVWGPIVGDNPAIMCSYREVPDGLPLEGSRAARITLWPIGVECTYWDADGPAVTTQDDWGKTVLALAGIALTGGGVTLLAHRRPRAQTS